jgi:hypothetical protein
MNDFAALILTHGRPDSVVTYDKLRQCGYTGRIVIVIDDEDKTADQYRARYGEEVEMFCKLDIAKRIDEADNFKDRRAIVYARNAAFDIAERLGVRYFIQLDDDYTRFSYRFDKEARYEDKATKRLDDVFAAFLKYYKATPFASIAMAQGGDHLGGRVGNYAKRIRSVRKAMNSFFCDTQRRFQFDGRINEDVNTYTTKQRAGLPFLTVLGFSLEQKRTQSNAGGMTELYLDGGTHIKSFYSVMMAPSCVKEYAMGEAHKRIHHRVNWKAAAPVIIREKHRKARPL